MSELWPRLSDIRLSFDLLTRLGEPWVLTDEAHRALMCLVGSCASGLVWTYSPPGDGSLPDDDVILARVTCLTKRRWKKVRPEVSPFFRIAEGRWHLDREWIAIDDRTVRFAIPTQIREIVRIRQGERCTYCGDTDGPFEFDHILPVSRGGKNEPSNLT